MTKKIKDINPLVDDWDSSMIPEFNDKQLINALHNCLDMVFEVLKEKNVFANIGRMFFNSIIIEIEKRLKNPDKRKKPKKETLKKIGKTVSNVIEYLGSDDND